jgi:hypothetical protein
MSRRPIQCPHCKTAIVAYARQVAAKQRTVDIPGRLVIEAA